MVIYQKHEIPLHDIKIRARNMTEILSHLKIEIVLY